MSRRSLVLFLALSALTRASAQTQSGAGRSPSDPYLWLEDQRGARAMARVATENAKTTGVLEKDPRFASLFRDALAVAQASDRIPNVRFIGGQLYNFWQDECACARHLAHAPPLRRLSRPRTAGPRCSTSTRSRPPKRRTGSGRRRLRLRRATCLSHLAVRRWGGRVYDPRVRPRDPARSCRTASSCPAASRTRRGPPRTRCWWRANGARQSHDIGIPVHRQVAGARSRAVGGVELYAAQSDESRSALAHHRWWPAIACSAVGAAGSPFFESGAFPRRTPAGLQASSSMPKKANL